MYSTAEWDLDLSRGYWDRRPFFLAEGSTVQWTVTTDSAVPSAFYVFGSAAAYADYAAHRRTAPLVAANGTHFAGNLTADNYGEYVFVLEAGADTTLHWQLRFWRTRLSTAAALESCVVDHSVCRLHARRNVCVLPTLVHPRDFYSASSFTQAHVCSLFLSRFLVPSHQEYLLVEAQGVPAAATTVEVAVPVLATLYRVCVATPLAALGALIPTIALLLIFR